ncbi:MAG: ribosome maturation factor RimP [Bacillota bacterium]|nr:ribosome maturation factor RimP [Bacillota bacterium]
MSNQNTAEMIYELISPLFNKELKELELVDVEYKKEGTNWYLRIFIDKDTGISLDDCQQASRVIEQLIDDKDPILTSYFLEVSSPGIERPLKKESDYEKYKNKLVKIKTYGPIDGKKEFIGELQGLNDGQIVLQLDNHLVSIPLDKVASANLTIEKEGE